MNNDLSKGLGIAGLIVGIIALIVSFIPCFGIYAFWIGIIGLLLGGLAFYIANRNYEEKGLAIAALIVSALASIIAYAQYHSITSALENAGGGF